MILIITNRQDQTADFLILELKKRKVDFIRFNTEDFPSTIGLVWELFGNTIDGRFIFPKIEIKLNEIKSIWYRRPVFPIVSPEIKDLETIQFVVEESRAALDGVWKTLSCFWVSHPDSIRIAENKLYQLRVALEIGFSVWPTTITNEPNIAKEFYDANNQDIIYKPLKMGRLLRGERQTLIFTNPVDLDASKEFYRVKYAPCLFQKYIHKLVELRVTVIGNKAFAFEIESQNNVETLHDWRRSQISLPHRPINLPDEIEFKCIKLVEKLGLEFGAIDLIVTNDNQVVFLEINPNGQWAWLQQLFPSVPMRETLADLLIEGKHT